MTTGRIARMRRRAEAAPGLIQLLSVAALIALCAALAMAHAAAVARPIYVLLAVALAWRAQRRSPWAYVTFVLWIWTLSPLARRLVDYYGGFVFSNPMLITPNLICFLMLIPLLRAHDLWRRPGAATALLALLPISYGLGISLVAGDVTPGLVSAADWLPPVMFYLYVIHSADSLQAGEPWLRQFVVLNTAVIGFYGAWQYISPTPWDVEWVLDSKMQILGPPVPFGLKVFSTLASPGTCALWLACLSVLSMRYRTVLTPVVLPAAVMTLAMTLVRSAGGVAVGGIAGVVLLRGGKAGKAILPIGLAVGALAVALTVFDPRMSDSLMDRLGTLNDLSQDASAQARMEIYRQTPGMMDAHPFGMGIGAFGRGARAAASSTEVGATDSGPLEIFLALGWVAGSLYLVGLFTAAFQAVRAGLSARGESALPFAMVAGCGAFVILFINLVGLEGTMLWFCAGMAVAFRNSERGAALSAPARPIAQPSAQLAI